MAGGMDPFPIAVGSAHSRRPRSFCSSGRKRHSIGRPYWQQGAGGKTWSTARQYPLLERTAALPGRARAAVSPPSPNTAAAAAETR